MILVSRNIKYNIRGSSMGEGASPSSTIRLNDVCCYSHNYWLFQINIRSMRWIRSA